MFALPLGALNLTHDAYSQAIQVKKKNDNSFRTVTEAQQSCKRTENLITRLGSQFTQGLEENNKYLQKLTDFLNEIEGQIPSLNQQVAILTLSPLMRTFISRRRAHSDV